MKNIAAAQLWRVRRRLICSTIFIGCHPSLLVFVFSCYGGAVLFMSVASRRFAYLFKERLRHDRRRREGRRAGQPRSKSREGAG
jgi:hypothetical protein